MKMMTLSCIAIGTTILAGCSAYSAWDGNSGGNTGSAPYCQASSSNTPAADARGTVVNTQGFQAWKAGFRQKALNSGIRADVFEAAFAGVGLNQRVLELDSNQAEFNRQIWDYIDSAAGPSRVRGGREKLAELGGTADNIEARYRVPKEVFVAIWGMESSYGASMGQIPVVEAMATLAYDGRRRGFAEEQLLAALRIIQAGDKSPERMVGSWAGAMGHTQFIPTSYLSYAVDYTGDGKRDIWYAPDALASTANYLAKNGWQYGIPWGAEVTVPSGFNYANASESNRQSAGYWNNQGVRLATGGQVPNWGSMGLIAPAGASGPKFVVTKNFGVIKRYNNATSYALGVGHLSDKLAGGGEFVQRWPRGEQALNAVEKEELQRRLTAQGFDTCGVDGAIGKNTERAIKAYQQANGLTPDGFATKYFLQRLR